MRLDMHLVPGISSPALGASHLLHVLCCGLVRMRPQHNQLCKLQAIPKKDRRALQLALDDYQRLRSPSFVPATQPAWCSCLNAQLRTNHRSIVLPLNLGGRTRRLFFVLEGGGRNYYFRQ